VILGLACSNALTNDAISVLRVPDESTSSNVMVTGLVIFATGAELLDEPVLPPPAQAATASIVAAAQAVPATQE